MNLTFISGANVKMNYESIYGNCSYELSPVYFEERESVIRDGHLI